MRKLFPERFSSFDVTCLFWNRATEWRITHGIFSNDYISDFNIHIALCLTTLVFAFAWELSEYGYVCHRLLCNINLECCPIRFSMQMFAKKKQKWTRSTDTQLPQMLMKKKKTKTLSTFWLLDEKRKTTTFFCLHRYHHIWAFRRMRRNWLNAVYDFQTDESTSFLWPMTE